jgi:hypothetical protein
LRHCSKASGSVGRRAFASTGKWGTSVTGRRPAPAMWRGDNAVGPGSVSSSLPKSVSSPLPNSSVPSDSKHSVRSERHDSESDDESES